MRRDSLIQPTPSPFDAGGVIFPALNLAPVVRDRKEIGDPGWVQRLPVVMPLLALDR
jgi:hypothetical protein